MDFYEIKSKKRRSLDILCDGYPRFNIDFEETEGMLELTFEDSQGMVRLEAPKDMLYEYFSGVINILTDMKGV